MSQESRALSVLLVEDNPGDRALLRAVLRAVGASVVINHAESLAEAEASLDGALPDVLLLDLSLPDAVGMDGIHRLRRGRPGVPIVVLTGLDDRDLADRALAAGAQDYLVKGPAVTGPLIERTLRYAVLRHQLLAEREAHQAVVERSEASFRAVAAGADGLLIADLNGRVQYANPAALALFAASESELVGHNLPFPLEPGDRREVEIGAQVTAEIVVATTRWAGAPAVLASLRDVTAQRQLQASLGDAQAMQLVGCLAAGVAHDFNNLLTGLQGHLDLARMTVPEEHPATRHLVAMDETIQVAARLVSRLLATGRRRAETPRRVDPGEVVRGIERILVRSVGGGVNLSIEIAEGLPAIMMDPVQLEQVVINLVENARDAVSRRGRIQVTLDTTDELDLRLVVADDGPGIAPEIRGHLFDPFRTTKREGHGMGLGLTTVRDIVERVQGEVSVASVPGTGATFTVLIPAATSTRRRPTSTGVRSTTADVGRRTVLVVDDELVVRTLLGSALRQQGYRVVTAEDGPDALGLFGSGLRPDLLLTDIVMPGMTGVELADQLTSLLPDLPVIFMSGFTDDLRCADGSRREDVRFLAKPFRIAELTRAIAETLERLDP